MAILHWGVKFDGPLKTPDFDRKVMRKHLGKMGREVAKIGRKLVSKKAVSEPGQYPGKDTGTLQKSIKAKVSKSGFSVGIRPYPQYFNGGPYYPAFVYYGHRAPNTETAAEARSHKKRTGKKVAAPRKNFVADAAMFFGKTRYEAEMQALMAEAIRPGLISKGLG